MARFKYINGSYHDIHNCKNKFSKMIINNGGSNSCYNTNVPQGLSTYNTIDLDQDLVSSSQETSSSMESHTNSFLYNLSHLKEKVHQVQSLATIFISPNDHDHRQHLESTALVMPTMTTLIQEIIVTSTSLMFTCQQMALGASSSAIDNANHKFQDHHIIENQSNDLPNCDNNSDVAQGFFSNNDGTPISSLLGSRVIQEPSIHSHVSTNNLHTRTLKETATTLMYQRATTSGDNNDYDNMQSTITGANHNDQDHRKGFKEESNNGGSSPRNYDVFEFDAADLLAKYTHYCQVCGKGFKRDANLRMHMRAHGDEYKSNAALINPMKNNNNNGLLSDDNSIPKLPRKYSCPQEGCRWNKKHAKFQPLKSMICVKNHYKRSHCPKMYICNRCNRKQFSLLSDLRTHEKHCGDLKWQCSCGTTFSRKDKLMGHVALFVGHTPLISTSSKLNDMLKCNI